MKLLLRRICICGILIDGVKNARRSILSIGASARRKF